MYALKQATNITKQKIVEQKEKQLEQEKKTKQNRT